MADQFNDEEREKLNYWYTKQAEQEKKRIKEWLELRPRLTPSTAGISPGEMDPSLLFQLLQAHPELMRSLDTMLLRHMVDYARGVDDDKGMIRQLNRAIENNKSFRPPGI